MLMVYGHKSSSERYIRWLKRQGVRVGEHVQLYTPWSIKIDTQHPWMISIGDNVHITADCSILQHDWSWIVAQRKTGILYGSSRRVSIGNNVFIGQRTLILNGADIGDNTIIGAGSVVTGKLVGDAVYAGVPARKISSLDEYIDKLRQRQLSDAVSLVNDYKRTYRVWPSKDSLREFFWLFEPRLGELNPKFEEMIERNGNSERSGRAFRNSIPLFNGYTEFLTYANSQRGDVDKDGEHEK